MVIAPGQRWHVPMSKRAMLPGKHVFCEMPPADTRAHGPNLPWRALKLGAPRGASVTIPEPLKDGYPSARKRT